MGNHFVALKDGLLDQNLVLFQDNTTIDKFVSPSDGSYARKFKPLDFPGNSTDLNSIEFL